MTKLKKLSANRINAPIARPNKLKIIYLSFAKPRIVNITRPISMGVTVWNNEEKVIAVN